MAKPTRKQKSNRTARPTIEPRALSFDVENEPAGRWHRNNPYISHFWNGLSLMFPEGERFLARSVARVRKQVHDPQLQREIAAFLAQEGIHAREHVKYNRALRRQGYPTRLLELVTWAALRSTQVTSERWQLAVTSGLEHFTATFANTVLGDAAILEGATPEFAALWRWHCAEEIEHKSVAFDVYEELAPGLIGYLRRVVVMMFLSAYFLPYAMVHQIVLSTGDRIVPDPREVARALQYFWTRPGLIPRGLRLYLDYYRPRFQPWDHDNTDALERWRRGHPPTA